MPDEQHFRLGTRASRLARWQADWVANQLRQIEGVTVELVSIGTAGDRDKSGAIETLGTQGVFTKGIQQALLDNKIDLAVHSLKDLPTDSVAGLCLASVPPREAVGDVLVSREGLSLEELPQGARIGTGSLRRRAQLWHLRRDFEMLDLRGNVETRLEKLRSIPLDAVVLAEAGLRRLDLIDVATQFISTAIVLPAVGQGALGIETRSDDHACRNVLATLEDPATRAAVTAERALLAELRGGCLAPVGAWGRLDDSQQALDLSAVVLSHDGRQRIEASDCDRPENAESLGRRVAKSLLEQGAAELIRAARDS